MPRCSFKKADGLICKLKTCNEFCHIHLNTTDCSICYEKINKKEKYKTKCNHSFHSNCINKWLERDNKCPLCRGILPHSVYKITISDNSGLFE